VEVRERPAFQANGFLGLLVAVVLGAAAAWSFVRAATDASVGLVALGVSVGDLFGGEAFGSGRELALVAVFGGAGVLTFIPALYFGIPLYLMQAELTFNEDVSPTQALRNCYTLAHGERLSIFGVSLLVGLLVFGGMLACCVGILPALALGQLLLGGLYLALRNGSMALAGTDSHHVIDFEQQAEDHRYAFTQRLNALHTNEIHFENDRAQRLDASRWREFPPFEYRRPSLGQAVSHAGLAAASLLGWAVLLLAVTLGRRTGEELS